MTLNGQSNLDRSIADELIEIHRLTNLMRTQPRCSTCDATLEHEPGSPGYADEPPATGGWWCTECKEWDDD